MVLKLIIYLLEVSFILAKIEEPEPFCDFLNQQLKVDLSLDPVTATVRLINVVAIILS